MKFVILNGSPKGNESVTMQYILYIKKKHPEHEYVILNVAQMINKLETKQEKLLEVIQELKNADGIVWGFPVYVMLVCSQYKRFIELIFDRGFEELFNGKYTTVLSTSIHFYDHTAQNYIHGICDDLNMKYFGFFAADSWDLLYPDRRKNWLFFFEKFINVINTNQPTSRYHQSLTYREFHYESKQLVNESDKIDTRGKNVLVLSEDTNNSTNLGRMVNTFKKSFLDNIELININEIDIAGPCIGCTKCGYNHECIYKDKDEFTDFWTKKVMQADILIFAGSIQDRFLSSRWKLVYDRAFFNNHTPTIIDKQLGYIISGPLSQIPNLREILQAHVEYQDSNFLGFITDEFGTSEEIDGLLYNFGKLAVEYSLANFIKPRTFLGEAAMKVFRDDIYGRNRFVFLADHEYYESHGVYNTFPQNDERAKKLNEKLIPLMKIDKVRNRMDLKQEFLRPFKKLLESPNK